MAQKNKISVSVIGLGRVGLMTLFHLAKKGFFPYGADVDSRRIHQLKKGKIPFLEPEFDKFLKKYRSKIKWLAVFPDAKYNFISTPTPFNESSQEMDLTSILSVLGKIEKGSLKGKYVFIRSTLSPGACKKLSRRFQNLSISYFPEFFREGHFAEDYNSAKFSVLASSRVERVRPHFDQFLFAKAEYCAPEEAEILKILCNLFHSLKVSFANEAGRLAQAFHVSPSRIMELFTRDKKLNISKAYLRPGFSFGGPCLKKDIQSLSASQKSSQILIAQCVEQSNSIHTQWAVRQILKFKPKTIAVLGCSFTGGKTIDYSDSPVLKLAELLSQNKKIKILAVEKALKPYARVIFSESSFAKLLASDMFILGGWTPLLERYSPLFSNYKGVLFDLLIQDLPGLIKNNPNYKNLYS